MNDTRNDTLANGTVPHFGNGGVIAPMAASFGIMILAVLSNGLLLLQIYRHKSLRTRFNYYVGQYAFIDLLIALLSMPGSINLIRLESEEITEIRIVVRGASTSKKKRRYLIWIWEFLGLYRYHVPP